MSAIPLGDSSSGTLFSLRGDILGSSTADRSIGGGGQAHVVRHQTVQFSFRRGSTVHFNCSYKSRFARDTDSGRGIIPDSGMRSDDLADTAGSWRMDGARTLLAELPLCRRYRAKRSCRGCSDRSGDPSVGIPPRNRRRRVVTSNTWRSRNELAGQAGIPFLRLGASLFSF